MIESAESEYPKLNNHEITFEEFQHVTTNPLYLNVTVRLSLS